MEHKATGQASFSIEPEEFLKELRRLQGPSGLDELWLSIESRIVRLTAIGSNIQVDDRGITLVPKPRSSDDQIHTGISVLFPRTPCWQCERRTDEKGAVRLSLRFPVRQEDDGVPHLLEVSIATSEAGLTVADSETRPQ